MIFRCDISRQGSCAMPVPPMIASIFQEIGWEIEKIKVESIPS
jgi:hypothetical protein